MLKNKKKLRRQERRGTPGYVARAAQTLVLTGLLLGGANMAQAAGFTPAGGSYDTSITITDRQDITGAQEFKGGLIVSGSSTGNFHGLNTTAVGGAGTVTISGGTSSMTAGAGIWSDKLTISGGTLNASGIMSESDSAQARWRAGTMLGGDKGVIITGKGTIINLGKDAQIVAGRAGLGEDTKDYAGVVIDKGAAVYMRDSLIRASSKAGPESGVTNQDYTTLNIKEDGSLVVATAGTHNVIAARETTVGGGGILQVDGSLKLVGAMLETKAETTDGKSQAWGAADGTTGGQLTILDKGAVHVGTGALIANNISVSQEGGVFTANTLQARNSDPITEGGNASFKSYTLTGGSAHVGSITIAGTEMNGTSGYIAVKDGTMAVGNLTLTSAVDGKVENALTGITGGNRLTVGVLTAKGGTKTSAQTDLSVAGAFHLLGDGSKFVEAQSLTIESGGKVFFDNNTTADGIFYAAKGGTFTGETTIASGGALNAVSGGNTWTLGKLTTAGNVLVQNNDTLNVSDLKQTAGSIFVTDGGKMNVSGSLENTVFSGTIGSEAGIGVGNAGAFSVGYGKMVDDKGDLVSTVQAIDIAQGGVLELTGYTGPELSLTDFKTISDKVMTGTSKGVLQGITITGVDESTKLQDVADAKASVPGAVVDGKDGILSGSAAVGGVSGTTKVEGGASLILTGQGAANGKLTGGDVTIKEGALTLGNAAGGSTGGTVNGSIDGSASTGSMTVQTVNGNFTVAGDIKGGSKDDTLNVFSNSVLNVNTIKLDAGNDKITITGGQLNAGSIVGGASTIITVGNQTNTGVLTADSVKLGGGTLLIDPSWGSASSKVGIAKFDDTGAAADISALGGLVGVGMNSLLSVGNKDTTWLETAVQKAGGLSKDGYDAALGLAHSVTLANGAGGIEVDGTKVSSGGTKLAPAKDSAVFSGKSLLVITAQAGLGTNGALHAEKAAGGTLKVADGATLVVVNAQAGQNIKVATNFKDAASTVDASKSWSGDKLLTDTALIYGAGTWDKANGNFTAAMKQRSAIDVFPLLSGQMAGLVDNVMPLRDLYSNNAGIRFVSRATSDAFIGTNNRTLAAATIEGAAQVAAVGGVQMTTMSAANAASGAVLSRTSMVRPLTDTTRATALHMGTDGQVSLDQGLSAGSGMNNGVGLWLMPLYQSNNAFGMEAGNFTSGFNSDLGGIAIGADYTFNDMFRAGIAFNAGGGYAQSNGDFNKTDNRFNFWGLSLYGGWTMNNFGLTADVGYTSSFNELEQDMPAAMAMSKLKADVNSSAWNAGLKGEYKWETSVMDIIPHVGVRYMGLTTDSYDVKSGGTVFKTDSAHQSVWTFPIGVTFSKDIKTSGGWNIKPQLDLSVVPAAGDFDAISKSRIPGVPGSAEMKMQVVDAITWDGGIGLEVGKNNLSFGVNYNIQASEHRTGHMVFGTLRYEF